MILNVLEASVLICFVQRAMVFNQQIPPSYISESTRIYQPCYCTVYVYDVIHFVLSMFMMSFTFLSVRISAAFHIFFYLYCCYTLPVLSLDFR